jgi:hypothetical protein
LDKKKKKDVRQSAHHMATARSPPGRPNVSIAVAAVALTGGNMSTYPAVAIERPSSVELKSGKILSIGCQFKATTKIIIVCAFLKGGVYSRVSVKIIWIYL